MNYWGGSKSVSCNYIQRQLRGLHYDLPRLPNATECVKLFTGGGYSSIALITKIAREEGIKNLTVTTLRVGSKELQVLQSLRSSGRIQCATFYVGGLFATDRNRKYDYYTELIKACEQSGWKFYVVKNHSKIILAETQGGKKFVVETSSNLNENPKMEQFSIVQDADLYAFYLRCLEEVLQSGKS